MNRLLFDAGQTQLRVRIVSADETTDFELPGFTLGDDVARFLGEAIAELMAAAHVSSLETIAGGSTGLYGNAPHLESLGHEFAAKYGTQRFIVADDALTGHLGALGGTPGVVVAAGTGLVALGLAPDRTRAARVDGAGALLGDNGAGWWIARQALVAALSDADGRAGGSAALRDHAERHFGVPVLDVPSLVARHESPIATVAQFAADSALAAREGDPIASSIWREAGIHIGNAVVASAKRVGFSDSVEWMLVGRVGNSRDLLEPALTDTVTAVFPSASERKPVGDALAGAALLETLPNLGALSPLVAEYRDPTRRGDA